MGRQDKIQYIISSFDSLGLPINENQACQYYDLYEFMVDYNKNVNLTSITDFEEVVVYRQCSSFFNVFSDRGRKLYRCGHGCGISRSAAIDFSPRFKRNVMRQSAKALCLS